MKALILLLVATVAMFLVACANGADGEVTPTSVQEVTTPSPTMSSWEASPSPPTPDGPVTETPQPTPLPDSLWDSCFGIPREEGSELIAVGENYCIVESTLSVQVAIWPPSITEASDTAKLAAKDLEDPCRENVVYFFSNLPELEFPKVQVKKYVCAN